MILAKSQDSHIYASLLVDCCTKSCTVKEYMYISCDRGETEMYWILRKVVEQWVGPAMEQHNEADT